MCVDPSIFTIGHPAACASRAHGSSGASLRLRFRPSAHRYGLAMMSTRVTTTRTGSPRFSIAMPAFCRAGSNFAFVARAASHTQLPWRTESSRPSSSATEIYSRAAAFSICRRPRRVPADHLDRRLSVRWPRAGALCSGPSAPPPIAPGKHASDLSQELRDHPQSARHTSPASCAGCSTRSSRLLGGEHPLWELSADEEAPRWPVSNVGRLEATFGARCA